MFLIGFIVIGLIAQQPAAPLVHCKLIRGERTWQGVCGELFGEKPALNVSLATSMKTGRYQKNIEPTAIYAGDMRIQTGGVPVEIEVYAGGAGILRPEGLNWLVVVNVVSGSQALEFDVDPAKTVPPADLDRDIVTRAIAILSTESVWDRADDRQCSPEDKTWSIYCAMVRATMDVTGGIHHRRPAMEVVRQIVDERSAGRKYDHRLRDYNNDPSTTFADLRSLFAEAMTRLRR